MRRTIVALVAAAVVLVGSVPSEAITYGQPDGTLHPNVGSLLRKNRKGSFFQWCSGSLIASDVFLTAAHCIQGEDPNTFWVTFDPVLSQDMSVIHGVAHYDHRAYTQGESRPHDVAVVVLDHPVSGVTPVQLPAAGLLDRMKARHELKDATFTAVGYGTRRISQQGGDAGILNNRKRRYVEQSYNTLLKQWLQLDMNPATGSGGTCFGDSGGPHFLGGVDSNLEVALTVTGDAVCKATDTDFRLDTSEARSFLKKYVTLP